jgi:hypothetical protein
MPEASSFVSDLEPLLATVARLFAADGSAREVAILANAQASIKETSYDNWNGGTTGHSLFLAIPNPLYSQVVGELEICEQKILDKTTSLLRQYPNDHLEKVHIAPILTADKDWREKAKTWLNGEGVSNQGRVRSDNVATRLADGLLFRSEPEIFLYKALKSAGVSFAPLPVFV